MLGPETEFFVKRLSDFLAAKWGHPYGVVMGEYRLAFLLLSCGQHCCVHGSCTKWRSLGIVDGASLPLLICD